MVRWAHRQCRQDEWMGMYQWKLSFSRAEIVLVKSWMPVQQIVYHMLRFFIKTERLTESADHCEVAVISNYHVKTLMLWACELKSKSWWTKNLDLIRICVELLHTLSVWLTDRRCPHYFVANCNLLDNSFNVESVASKLLKLDREYLSKWFIRNYIGKCAQLCPRHIRLLFSHPSSATELRNAISEIAHWRQNSSQYALSEMLSLAEYFISYAVSVHSLSVRSCVCWMDELTKIDERCCAYFSTYALLHVAHKLSRNGLSDKLMDISRTVLQRQFNHHSSILSRCKTERNTSELVEFLQTFAVEHLTTYRQLVARDFGSVDTIVTTDFEAMYAYKHGDYKRCLQLSTQNVHALMYGGRIHGLPIFPELIQLIDDDDIVSLTALTLLVDPRIRPRERIYSAFISQLTLSLYLMAQCQLNLHHSVTSLAQTLDYIEVAQRRLPRCCTLDYFTLKLIERKVLLTALTD